jgi:hypothetical protein
MAYMMVSNSGYIASNCRIDNEWLIGKPKQGIGRGLIQVKILNFPARAT